jgi:type IX secretion system substrate protein
MKKVILHVMLICLLPLSMMAGEQGGMFKNEAIRQYVSKNIIPVVVEKRKAFDVNLTVSEQNSLVIYRNELKDLGLGMFHQGFMFKNQGASTENNSSALTDEEKQARREQMKELYSKIRVIAENHKAELDKILSDLKPQREKWTEDISQIRATQKAQKGSELSDNQEQAVSSEKSSNHNNSWGHNRMLNRVGFLLMNPTESLNSDNERQAAVSDIIPSLSAIELYPNPSADQFTLNLASLPEQNKLEITDLTGKIVYEKDNVLSTEIVPCSNLNNGIYIVRLLADDQIVNKKLVVNH